MQRALPVLACLIALGAIWWFGLRDDQGAPAPTDETPVTGRDSSDLSADDEEAAPGLEALGKERAAPATKEEPPAPLEDGITVSGRVLDDRRRPVVGATVLLSAGYDTGQYDLTGTTGEGGRYRIHGLRPPSAWGPIMVRCHHADRAGQAGAFVGIPPRNEIPIGDILLGPAHALDVQVRLEGGGAASGARILLESRQMFQGAAIADVEADASGAYRFEGLPESGYRVLAVIEGRARGATRVALPQRKPGPVVVTLGTERKLVAVVTDEDSEEPIVGARVLVDEVLMLNGRPGYVVPWLPPMPELLTDAQGRVAIPGLGLQDGMQAGAEAEGYPKRGNTRTVDITPFEDTEVKIQLGKTRTLRFPVAMDNPHAPPEGTLLAVAASSGSMNTVLPEKAYIEDGHVVAHGCTANPFHAHVIARCGAWADLYATGEGAHERDVVFEKPRRVVVVLEHADGSPARGYFVSVRTQGNNVIVDPTPLGPEGRVELDVRYAHLVDVFAAPTSSRYGGKAIGSINLKEDGGTVEAILPSARRVELGIMIDGEARLPARFTIHGAMSPEEDPEAGVVRFDLAGDPAQAQKVTLTAQGYLQQTIEVPAGEPGKLTRIAVALSRGGSILLKIKPPADGVTNVQILKPGAVAHGMPIQPGRRTTVELGEEEGWTLRRIGPYEPGVYVASDAGSHARSEDFTVKLGEETVVAFDLSHVGEVKGRVEVPEGFTTAGAQVGIHREGVAPGPMERFMRAYVQWDGSFTIRVPGDTTVQLKVFHPQLIPAEPGGTLQITEPRDGVILKLAQGGTARFTLDPPLDPTTPGGATGSPVSVLLYDGSAHGKPDQTHTAVKDGDGYKISGFKPGMYSVVVNARRRVPKLLGRLSLAVDTDLGALQLSAGGRLRFKLLVPEGQDPPRIYVNVQCTSGIEYYRYINSNGESEVVLTGLGAGSFKLYAMSMSGFGGVGAASDKGKIDKTIESDGSSEIVLEMDMR